MKRSLLCLLFAFFYTCLLAQKDCRQEEYQRHILKLYPQVQVQYDKLEQFSKAHSFNRINGTADTLGGHLPPPGKIIIPVVVHILWNNSAQNISDVQVLSQIDVLNKDYSGLNTDRNKIPSYFSEYAADCGISFVLAKTDPSGNATNGIVRKQTSVTVFQIDDRAKSSASNGDDPWNSSSYLNIWVCNLESGICGYSSIPGGPSNKDGVVISSNVFGALNMNGPFNKGRTAVHEVGHWLNLRHLWGDANCGDDLVDDTPAQQAANRGCNSGEKFTCGSTAHGDMYMDYMDFSDDACMYMFTNGQRARMRALFDAGGARSSILSSNALKGDGIAIGTEGNGQAGFDVLLYPNPASNTVTVQFANNMSFAGRKIMICNRLGQAVKVVFCSAKLQQLDVSALPAGLYFIKVDGPNSNGMKKFVKQ